MRKRAAKHHNTIVYLVRFRHVSGLEFLKIGMTRRTVEERFVEDAVRLHVAVIASSRRLQARSALALEKALQALFEKHSMRPEIPLVSGNTECFVSTADLTKRAADLINQTLT